MIARLTGRLTEVRDYAAHIYCEPFTYQVLVAPAYANKLVAEHKLNQDITLETYYYIQNEQSKSIPCLIGFETQLEKDFFEIFITVSGVGPKAALKAFSKPVSMIAEAIDVADQAFLKSLPGIGARRAMEIIAKLQGRVGRFCLLPRNQYEPDSSLSHLRVDAVEIMKQLQYSRQEAEKLIDAAMASKKGKIDSVEDLLNEVYRTNK